MSESGESDKDIHNHLEGEDDMTLEELDKHAQKLMQKTAREQNIVDAGENTDTYIFTRKDVQDNDKDWGADPDGDVRSIKGYMPSRDIKNVVKK